MKPCTFLKHHHSSCSNNSEEIFLKCDNVSVHQFSMEFCWAMQTSTFVKMQRTWKVGNWNNKDTENPISFANYDSQLSQSRFYKGSWMSQLRSSDYLTGCFNRTWPGSRLRAALWIVLGCMTKRFYYVFKICYHLQTREAYCLLISYINICLKPIQFCIMSWW